MQLLREDQWQWESVALLAVELVLAGACKLSSLFPYNQIFFLDSQEYKFNTYVQKELRMSFLVISLNVDVTVNLWFQESILHI